MRLLLSEALLLGAGSAAIVSLGVASVATKLALPLMASFGEAVTLDVSPDWRVLAFTAALGLAATACFGLVPIVATLRSLAHARARRGRPQRLAEPQTRARPSRAGRRAVRAVALARRRGDAARPDALQPADAADRIRPRASCGARSGPGGGTVRLSAHGGLPRCGGGPAVGRARRARRRICACGPSGLRRFADHDRDPRVPGGGGRGHGNQLQPCVRRLLRSDGPRAEGRTRLRCNRRPRRAVVRRDQRDDGQTLLAADARRRESVLARAGRPRSPWSASSPT